MTMAVYIFASIEVMRLDFNWVRMSVLKGLDSITHMTALGFGDLYT